MLATVSRTLRTPLTGLHGARRTRRVVSCNYGGFISGGVCIAPGCVYRSSSAKRGVGIPGDRIKRVETYHNKGERGCVGSAPGYTSHVTVPPVRVPSIRPRGVEVCRGLSELSSCRAYMYTLSTPKAHALSQGGFCRVAVKVCRVAVELSRAILSSSCRVPVESEARAQPIGLNSVRAACFAE
jgi:hypothetical protein